MKLKVCNRSIQIVPPSSLVYVVRTLEDALGKAPPHTQILANSPMSFVSCSPVCNWLLVCSPGIASCLLRILMWQPSPLSVSAFSLNGNDTTHSSISNQSPLVFYLVYFAPFPSSSTFLFPLLLSNFWSLPLMWTFFSNYLTDLCAFALFCFQWSYHTMQGFFLKHQYITDTLLITYWQMTIYWIKWSYFSYKCE